VAQGVCPSCGSTPCEELPDCGRPTVWPKRRGEIPTHKEQAALAKGILDSLRTPVVDGELPLS